VKDSHDDNWKQLVLEARNDDAAFEKLIANLETTFYTVAGSLAADSLVDDLVQLAIIRVWQQLGKVNLNQPGTIRRFLIVAGTNAMKSYLCRNDPLKNVDRVSLDNVVVEPTQNVMFTGLLLEYVEFIRANSTFVGSHKQLAKKHGVSEWTMRNSFNTAAGKFLKEINYV